MTDGATSACTETRVGHRMWGQIINHGRMEGWMDGWMDGGDILSHFPRAVAWTSSTPSPCTCFSVCSSHSHTCARTVHGHSRYSQAVQNRSCYLTYGVLSQLYHVWLYGSHSNISLLLGSWRPPPKPPFLSLSSVSQHRSTPPKLTKKMDVKAKLTQKARVELWMSA